MTAQELIDAVLAEIAPRLTYGQRKQAKRDRARKKNKRPDRARSRAAKKAHKKHQANYRRGARTRSRRSSTYLPV